MSISLILLVVALVLFLIGAAGTFTRFNLIALGLACCVGAVLVGGPMTLHLG
jgi:NADH:ubiquinone oxidoreductase subunit K